ncbi:MAG: DNA mismatch repair endonuclease MutL [Limnothrix sp.]
MAKIKTLPNDVVQLIAAGEVIDSFGAVVRELAENAIDAGASKVAIAIDPKLWKIKVVDNGHGMDCEDLERCVTPHSTSKLGDRHDLANISSLGFRGEALHSMTQVAQLTVATCISGDTGHLLKAHQNQISTTTLHPMSVGTMVTVEDLFGSFPVRRNALPSLAQQLKTIQQFIYHLALCNPHITWQIEQARQPWLQISSGKTSADILPQLLKTIAPSDLQYRKFTPQDLENLPSGSALEVVIGLPDRCHRHQSDWLKIAVNGRVIKFPTLENAIISAFFRTLPRDRHPVCFLHLHVPPHHIDWNRHPAKSEIYLQNQDHWQDIIKVAIAETLRFSEASLPKVENQRVINLIHAAEKADKYSTETEKDLTETELVSRALNVIGQSRNTYILVEHSGGLWLVEQHIAHERILYEQLQTAWQLVENKTAVILSDLTPKQLEQLTENIGLTLETFGKNLWQVKTIPAALAESNNIETALLELADGSDLPTAQAAIACRTAVKNGTVLDQKTMQTIIAQWQQTQNPHTCPHGRPIYLSLEETSLYRFFRRHWVLGKSHGITEQKPATNR